jgi:hypothetical protein
VAMRASTVVEHSPLLTEVWGSRPGVAAGTGREVMMKKSNICEGGCSLPESAPLGWAPIILNLPRLKSFVKLASKERENNENEEL